MLLEKRNFQTLDFLVFVALAAIAIRFNNTYLAVESSLVLNLAFSTVILAAARHRREASAKGDREHPRSTESQGAVIGIYACFLLSILGACLVANVAWSMMSDVFPVGHMVDIHDLPCAIEMKWRVLKSLMIMSNFLIAWFMIRRFSDRSHGDAITKRS